MSDMDEYLKFNVGSIQDLIKQKLEPEFPDVNFRGSSANILSETIASVFSLLMYQLNRSASNSSFTKTQSLTSLIEQTKIIGYNPIGVQAGSMFVGIAPNNIVDELTYTIPRYSQIDTPVGTFSTTEDLEFTYSGSSDIVILDNVLMKGGSWAENPLSFSDGKPNQIIKLNPVNNDSIDHNHINIYVRDVNGDNKWKELKEVESLFLSNGSDYHFEKRLNTQGGYDIFLGDGVNGVNLPDGTEISIYFLVVNKTRSKLEVGQLSSDLLRFTTQRLNQILNDILDTDKTLVLNNTSGLFFVDNTTPNNTYTEAETLEEIRRNAPINFKTQNRLVTKEDFKSYILNNFNDYVSDVLVLNNNEYIESYLRYYYEEGLEKPWLESRALYNQLNYSDSCNFNNIYVFLISKNDEFLNDAQKQNILNKINPIKSLTSEIIPSDPIYINFGIATPTNEITVNDFDTSYLEIVKAPNSNRSNEDIAGSVYNVIREYFINKSSTFSNRVDVFEITSLCLGVTGVRDIYTVNGSIKKQGVHFYQFNRQFPNKVHTTPPDSLFSNIFIPTLFDNNIKQNIIIV